MVESGKMVFCAENKKICLPLKENIMLNAMFVGEISHQIATDMHITNNENNEILFFKLNLNLKRQLKIVQNELVWKRTITGKNRIKQNEL